MMLDTTQTVILISICVVLSVFIGYRIQHVSHFLRPKDPITLGLLALTLASMTIEDIPIVYCIPIIAGYVTGYILAGRDRPLFVQYVEPGNTNNWVDYYVLYDADGKTCIADQSNRAFLRRMVGVHHELRTDVPIVWKAPMSFHVPRKRRIVRGEGIYVNNVEEAEEKVKLWWKLHAVRQITHLSLADGSGYDNIDLARNLTTLQKQKRELARVKSQNYKLKAEVPEKIVTTFADFLFETQMDFSKADIEELRTRLQIREDEDEA